jgi:hypothetical protein
MEEKQKFEVPDVTTYDREELDLNVARTTIPPDSDTGGG